MIKRTDPVITPCDHSYRSIEEIGGSTYAVSQGKLDDVLYGTVNKKGDVIIPLKYEVLVGQFWSHNYGQGNHRVGSSDHTASLFCFIHKISFQFLVIFEKTSYICKEIT